MYVNIFCSACKINFFSLFSILGIPLTFHFILLWIIKSSYKLLFTILLGKGGSPETWWGQPDFYQQVGGNQIFIGVVDIYDVPAVWPILWSYDMPVVWPILWLYYAGCVTYTVGIPHVRRVTYAVGTRYARCVTYSVGIWYARHVTYSVDIWYARRVTYFVGI